MLTCPYCGSPAEPRDCHFEYTGKKHGMYMTCSRYPACDSYVATARHSGAPLGTLAGPELRALREEVHGLFDPIWRDKVMHPSVAKKWLGNHLGIVWQGNQIESLNEAQCRLALKYLKAGEAV